MFTIHCKVEKYRFHYTEERGKKDKLSKLRSSGAPKSVHYKNAIQIQVMLLLAGERVRTTGRNKISLLFMLSIACFHFI